MDIILLELILVLGVAISLGFWQLRDVNKALKSEVEAEEQEEESEQKQDNVAPSSGVNVGHGKTDRDHPDA